MLIIMLLIIAGICTGIAGGGVMYSILQGRFFYKDHNYASSIISGVLIGIISTALILGLSLYSINIKKQGDIDAYIVQKDTIEESLNSDVISDIERINLINQVNEKNAWLAKEKASQSSALRWEYSKKIKDQIFNLEYISIKGE